MTPYDFVIDGPNENALLLLADRLLQSQQSDAAVETRRVDDRDLLTAGYIVPAGRRLTPVLPAHRLLYVTQLHFHIPELIDPEN